MGGVLSECHLTPLSAGGHFRDSPEGRTFESEGGFSSFLSRDNNASPQGPRETQVYAALHRWGLRWILLSSDELGKGLIRGCSWDPSTDLQES